jgi:hypothetical protein
LGILREGTRVPKDLYSKFVLNFLQVELRRGNLDTMWGFSVEAELVENSEKQDELCCYVSRVEERSVAMNSGKKGQFRAY